VGAVHQVPLRPQYRVRKKKEKKKREKKKEKRKGNSLHELDSIVSIVTSRLSRQRCLTA
jgi:hypothetical protein